MPEFKNWRWVFSIALVAGYADLSAVHGLGQNADHDALKMARLGEIAEGMYHSGS